MQESRSVKIKTVAKSAVVKSVLISLLRQPTQIVALLSDEVDGVLQPGFRQVCLSTLDKVLFPQAANLLADWNSLQNAVELSSVWPAFWRVFWMTVPDPANVVTENLPRVITVKSPVATAANPRAFRGTKYQPPKQAQPDFDLCAWLADHRLMDAFFARHDFVKLPLLDAQGRHIVLAVDDVPGSAALLLRHWQMPAQALLRLPDGFKHYFLWQLRAAAAPQQLAWLQIWHRHNSMHADNEYRLENLHLLAHLCAIAALQYNAVELAQLLPTGRQNIFLRFLIREIQGRLSLQQMNSEQLIRLHELTEDDTRFEYYLGSVLRNLNRQVSVEYSLAGCLLFEMSGETDLSSYRLTAYRDCKEELIDVIVQACDCACIHMHINIWRACAELPGLAQLLRETCWGKLTAQTADNLINVIFQFRWLDDDAHRLAKWRAYLQIHPRFHTVLIQLTGKTQEKLVLLWYQLIDGLDDNAEICATVEDGLPLLKMLAQAPYCNDIDYGYALPNLITYLPVHLRRTLPDLGRHFWSLFERACRRENDTRLLAFGIAGMAELSPVFLWQGLQSAAPRLFHTLRLLGSLEYERRLQFMREQMQTDWFACDWAALDLQTACRKMLTLSKLSKLDSPLPRRLRLHFEAQITLTDMQVQRHCRLTLTRFPGLRLRALEQAIWHDMDKSFKLREQSPSVRHALQLLASLDSQPNSNRKGLRRFLQNTKAGKPLCYLDHPLNLNWYAAHPRINKTKWEAGLQKMTIVDGAPVQLTFEQDPFEILKLGTYVGSCLSIGGVCNYSAVACLLDANKQVIYARNEKGAVIARQLVAIDEKDRLFCCAIYPCHSSPVMRAAFKSYDRELADLLGLELYRDQEASSYDVVAILAQCCWDDGPWLEE